MMEWQGSSAPSLTVELVKGGASTIISFPLAALRIEIERVLSVAASKITDNTNKSKSLRDSINHLYESQILSKEQHEAFQTICNTANKVVHGVEVLKNEAEEIVELAERLDSSFSLG
jgi:uncharacterized protein YutE (UPF0331/DUF86 family)